MVSSVHSLQRSTEQLPSLRVANRCNHQALAICGQGEGSIRADVEELKDTAIDHQGETIPMLGQTLDHMESSLLIVITMYHLSPVLIKWMSRCVRSVRRLMTHVPSVTCNCHHHQAYRDEHPPATRRVRPASSRLVGVATSDPRRVQIPRPVAHHLCPLSPSSTPCVPRCTLMASSRALGDPILYRRILVAHGQANTNS